MHLSVHSFSTAWEQLLTSSSHMPAHNTANHGTVKQSLQQSDCLRPTICITHSAHATLTHHWSCAVECSYLPQHLNAACRISSVHLLVLHPTRESYVIRCTTSDLRHQDHRLHPPSHPCLHLPAQGRIQYLPPPPQHLYCLCQWLPWDLVFCFQPEWPPTRARRTSCWRRQWLWLQCKYCLFQINQQRQ